MEKLLISVWQFLINKLGRGKRIKPNYLENAFDRSLSHKVIKNANYNI